MIITTNYNIKQYKTEKKSSVSLTHLILSYIREGKYTGSAWSIAAGRAPNDLAQYITKLDTDKNTKAALCRGYGEIELPARSVLITIDDGALGTGTHNGNKLI